MCRISFPIAKRRPLPINDTLQIGAQVRTESLPGRNGDVPGSEPGWWSAEQYHFNNFAYRNLYVKPDSLNPLLDVTFDGVHILNRDIVSSNQHPGEAEGWSQMDDTGWHHAAYPGWSIRMDLLSVSILNDTLRFNPAGQAPNTDNTATIDFVPYFPDGE